MDGIGRLVNGIQVRLQKQLCDFDLDVEWEVGPGFTVLFGYSGAGKSITLSMMCGTMRPDYGWIVVDDVMFSDSRTGRFMPAQQRQVGFVSQVADLFPHMTIRANVEYGLFDRPRAERVQRAQHMLEAFQIEELAEKKPGQISGGQHQRAALARALAPEPRLLLLDEPMSALDLPIRVEMRELLLQVQREHRIPVILVTHDLTEAVTLADTMVVYSGTGHVQTGTPQDILAAPETPEIERLLSCAAIVPDLMRRPDPTEVRR